MDNRFVACTGINSDWVVYLRNPFQLFSQSGWSCFINQVSKSVPVSGKVQSSDFQCQPQKASAPFFGPSLKGQREPKHYQDDYGDNNPRDEKKRLPGTRRRFGLLRSNPLNFLVR